MEAAEIIGAFDLVNPINTKEEKEKFFGSSTYNPRFKYKEFDASDLENRLNNLQPDDSEIGEVFKISKDFSLDYIKSLEKKEGINTYGFPSNKLVNKAYKILQKPIEEEKEDEIYNAEELKNILQRKIDEYGFKDWYFVLDENMVANIAINNAKREVRIKTDKKFSEKHAKKLQAHEIGSHVVRSENGLLQDYSIFATFAIPNGMKIDDGLAYFHEEKAGVSSSNVLRTYALNAIAVNYALTCSFRDTFNLLLNYLPKDQAFKKTVRVKRGIIDTNKPGGFSKDYIYLQGKIEIDNYIKEGNDLTPLYAGVIGIEHIPLVEKGILKKPKYLPIL